MQTCKKGAHRKEEGKMDQVHLSTGKRLKRREI
jgi:hypothetical protein